MYKFCKIFNCSPEEFERRSAYETQWLLGIDEAYNTARNELQEENARRS